MRMPNRRKDGVWSHVPYGSGNAVPGVIPGQSRPDPAMGTLVKETLDPVLVPLGFDPGQVGGDRERAEVIFCRGEIDSPDGGCVDLVLDLEATRDWQITDVRYWGFPSDRWHLNFDRGAQLVDQLAGLARSLPSELG